MEYLTEVNKIHNQHRKGLLSDKEVKRQVREMTERWEYLIGCGINVVDGEECRGCGNRITGLEGLEAFCEHSWMCASCDKIAHEVRRGDAMMVDEEQFWADKGALATSYN